jgi:hypothetical protein
MKYQYLVSFILLFVIFSCGDAYLPNGVLPKKKMVPIIVDIHLAEAINNQKFNISLQRDSLPEELYLSICKKHQTDRTVIERSLLYYGKHTEAYTEIYNEVLDVLSELEVMAKNDTLKPAHAGSFNLDNVPKTNSLKDTIKKELQVQ